LVDPETEIVTESGCVVLMLVDAGVTSTVGMVGFWLVPAPRWPPLPHAVTERTIAKMETGRKSFANRLIETSFLTISAKQQSC
jgi:hypothetical protein